MLTFSLGQTSKGNILLRPREYIVQYTSAVFFEVRLHRGVYVVCKPWLVGVYSEYTTWDRGQRNFAFILPEPKARAIWPQTSDDRGRGPYIRCIHHTSHGSYDIFYSTLVDYDLWVAARAVSVRDCDLNGCCSVLSAITFLWQRKRTKRWEEKNANYRWVVVVARVFTNISSGWQLSAIWRVLLSHQDQKHQGRVSYVRCIRHTARHSSNAL